MHTDIAAAALLPALRDSLGGMRLASATLGRALALARYRQPMPLESVADETERLTERVRAVGQVLALLAVAQDEPAWREAAVPAHEQAALHALLGQLDQAQDIAQDLMTAAGRLLGEVEGVAA